MSPSPKLPAKRKPPAKAPQSKQYDLFTQFFGKPEDLSNTIELWDAIPKYAVTARRQVSLRDASQRLPVHEYRFEYARRPCRLEVQPASIKVDGEFRDFYPSADEELVEEVLRKIFADQRHGIHVPTELESWVRFSLQMIRKELQARGKTRSLDEIKLSIDILANTVVRFYVEGEGEAAVYTNPILSNLIRVNRRNYADDSSALWAAQLPALISKSINELSYRQFDYRTFMNLSSQLARWFHKRLSHNYINASVLQSYEILYSSVRRDSGLLEHDRVNVNTTAIEKALNDLVAQKVLMNWSKQDRRGSRNKVEDILYTFHAGMEFIQQVKAANARQRDAGVRLGQAGRRALPSP